MGPLEQVVIKMKYRSNQIQKACRTLVIFLLLFFSSGALHSVLAVGNIVISGVLFVDNNKNGTKDAGESGLANTWVWAQNSSVAGPVGESLTDAAGNYSFTLPGNTSRTAFGNGVWCMSLPVPGGDPAGYADSNASCTGNLVQTGNGTLTATINHGVFVSPAPTATPIPPIPTATPAVTPGPTPAGRNISNLKFGILTTKPWMQTLCGDFRMDNGITDALPVGQPLMQVSHSQVILQQHLVQDIYRTRIK